MKNFFVFIILIFAMLAHSEVSDFRKNIEKYSFLDAPFNVSVGIDCMPASNIYPGGYLELYVLLLGVRVGLSGIRYYGDNNEFKNEWIGGNIRIGLTHREFIRLFDESKFLSLLVLEPSINSNTHNLSVLGEKTVKYNYTSLNLRMGLASNWLEIFVEPMYVLPTYNHEELNLSVDFLISFGITFHLGIE